jgi:hypothetical protein
MDQSFFNIDIIECQAAHACLQSFGHSSAFFSLAQISVAAQSALASQVGSKSANYMTPVVGIKANTTFKLVKGRSFN